VCMSMANVWLLTVDLHLLWLMVPMCLSICVCIPAPLAPAPLALLARLGSP